MRNPIDVLKSLESKATQENYKFQRLYRNLYNPEFYLLAYQNIAKSTGSMTSGADGMTLDGMSMTRINRIRRGGTTLPKRVTRLKSARWVFPLQTISWSRKLSVCCWKQSMNPPFRNTPMDSGQGAPATRH